MRGSERGREQGGDKQRWLPARAEQRAEASTAPDSYPPWHPEGQDWGWQPPTPQLAAGAGRQEGQAGKADLPRGGEELTEAAGAGCAGQSPLPSRTLAQEQHCCGEHRAEPAYIQCEGQGLPACGRSRNQSTCVPLPCHRESGQKARSQGRGGCTRVRGLPFPKQRQELTAVPALGRS